MTATPFLSVVMPARNAAAHIDRALRALRRSRFADFEIIVVDDASADGTAEIVRRFRPDLHLVLPEQGGADHARNNGALRARGEVVVFVDADVAVAPDTLGRVAALFRNRERQAVFGIYGLAQPHGNVCTLYKNAWIRHTFLGVGPRVGWFFTGFGAVRRSAWERCGGFLSGFRVETGGGDLAFGQRLARSGAPIELDRSLEVTHLKRFGFLALLRNDLRRAYGWSRLALRSGRSASRAPRKGFANVPGSFVLGVGLVGLGALVVALTLTLVPAGWPILLPLLALHTILAAPFYGYLRANLPWKVTAAAIPLMLADHLACGVGVAAGLVKHAITLEATDRNEERAPQWDGLG